MAQDSERTVKALLSDERSEELKDDLQVAPNFPDLRLKPRLPTRTVGSSEVVSKDLVVCFNGPVRKDGPPDEARDEAGKWTRGGSGSAFMSKVTQAGLPPLYPSLGTADPAEREHRAAWLEAELRRAGLSFSDMQKLTVPEQEGTGPQPNDLFGLTEEEKAAGTWGWQLHTWDGEHEVPDYDVDLKGWQDHVRENIEWHIETLPMMGLKKNANHRGVMVALRIPHSAALRVAIPGGEPPEDLHCTIAYLGDADDLDPERREDLVRRLKAVAATTPPLSGTLTGYGRFRDEERDQDVLWVGLDSPDLPALRHRVVQACEDAAVPLAGAHGWTPHISLSYVDEGQGEDSMPAPTEVEFKWISLVVAGTESQMRLAGDEHEHDKAPQEPYAYSWSMLMRPAGEDLTGLPELERWAVGRGDLLVRAVPDAQACVVVKKGRDVHVAIQAWDAPAYLDDLVVALRRVPHDYVLEGWLAARDLDGEWLPREELARVLCADVVASPVLMPRDLLALDGDLTGRPAADRLELLRGLMAEAGGHAVVPLQVSYDVAVEKYRPDQARGTGEHGGEFVDEGGGVAKPYAEATTTEMGRGHFHIKTDHMLIDGWHNMEHSEAGRSPDVYVEFMGPTLDERHRLRTVDQRYGSFIGMKVPPHPGEFRALVRGLVALADKVGATTVSTEALNKRLYKKLLALGAKLMPGYGRGSKRVRISVDALRRITKAEDDGSWDDYWDADLVAVIPGTILCRADDDLEAAVDACLAWRPSEGHGLAILGAEAVQAGSEYAHGPSAAVARLCVRTVAVKAWSDEAREAAREARRRNAAAVGLREYSDGSFELTSGGLMVAVSTSSPGELEVAWLGAPTGPDDTYRPRSRAPQASALRPLLRRLVDEADRRGATKIVAQAQNENVAEKMRALGAEETPGGFETEPPLLTLPVDALRRVVKGMADAMGAGPGPTDVPEGERLARLRQGEQAEPGFLTPEKTALGDDAGDETDAGNPRRVDKDGPVDEPRDEAGRWTNRPHPSLMTGGAINGELDRVGAYSSKLTQRMIDEGRGSELPSETRQKTDSLARDVNAVEDRARALRDEVRIRTGSDYPRLPHGVGRRPRMKTDTDTEKDAAPGVFGTPGVFGILSPEQGVFNKPRLPRNVDKEFGDNVSVGVPLTLVPTRPRGSRHADEETSNPGGPLFPHFTQGAGTGVHKELWSGAGNNPSSGDSFSVGPGVVGGHRFVVGRLKDGVYVADPAHPRVNPYEAIFLRRGVRLVKTGWTDEAREAALEARRRNAQGAEYARAGGTVDGLRVRGDLSTARGADVENYDSIEATLGRDWEQLDDIREVPVSAFEDGGAPSFYSATERARVEALAAEIKESGEIAPLIVVTDNSGRGPYVLEGGHRFDALKLLGKRSFPALVVRDTGAAKAAVPEGDDRFRAEEQTANPDSRKPRKWPDAPEEAGFNDSYLSKSDEPLYLTAADMDEAKAAFVAASCAGCVEKYAEDQPRVPAGSPEGGQFAGGASMPSMTQWAEWTADPGGLVHPEQRKWVNEQVRAGGYQGGVMVMPGNGPKFDVGEAHYTEGGHYSPGTDNVVVYLDSETPEGAAGIAAHEGAHGLWHAAKSVLERQAAALKVLPQPTGLMEHEQRSWPERSVGEDRLNPRLKDQFPLTYALRELQAPGMPEVAASGSNVSPYAAAWWKKWNAGGAHTDSAMNETVAEIEKLSSRWSAKADPAERVAGLGRLGVSPEWLAFHDEVVKAGRAVGKRGEGWKAAAATGTVTVIGPEGWGERHEADGTIRMLRPLRVEKYAEDQPRDEAGRWTDGEGARLGKTYIVEEPDRAAPTPDEERGTDGKVRLGDCYRQAGKYVTDHEDAALVHGEISPLGWMEGGFRGGHAWVEIRRPGGAELVYDGVQGRFYDKASYYRAFHAVPKRTYTPDEARVQMLRTRHWGPWH